MALVTVNKVKTHLAISGSSEDTALTQLVGQVSAAVRGYVGRYIGGQFTSVTATSPGVVTCPGHGLETNDVIVVAHSTTTPTLDGSRTVTRVDDDSFSLGVNVSGAGTAGTGTFARTLTRFHSGNGQQCFPLDEYPVQSISSLYLDSGAAFGEATDSFGASTLLVAGTDYNLVRNSAGQSLSGLVAKIGGVWPRPAERSAGLLGSSPGFANGNIKVTYTAGYLTIPADLVLAVCNLVAEMRRTAQTGGAAIQSESYDFYSYSLASATEAIESLSSVKSLLSRYKPVVW